MTTKARSIKGSKSSAPPGEEPPFLQTSADVAASSSIAPESLAGASDVSNAPASLADKPKKKKKKGTRKSKAPSVGNGTLELTPSTAAPPVVAKGDVAATEIDPDDISVPPAEDLDHDFFSAPIHHEPPPSMARAHYEPIHEMETRDPRIEALMTAEVKRRRAHFAKYVKAAVAISLVLCLAAVVRVGIRRNHGDDSTAMAATSVRPTPVVVVPDPPKTQNPIDPPPPAPEDTVAAEPAVEPPPVADPIAAPTTSPSAEPAKKDEPPPPATASAAPAASAEPAPSAVASAEPTEIDPKAAGKEKRLSQQSLDQGKIKDSIEHGEQSVKLDPTDAEAWLILGAAYQMKGDHKEARRCFASCIKEGKRGPKGECMAMPH